jgi:hypothetical protein
MTVQYEGNDYYSITIEDKKFVLHKSTIGEIQSYDFETGLESLTVSELNDKIEDLEYDIRDLTKTLEDTRDELEDTT